MTTTQRTAARLAGILYVALMFSAMLPEIFLRDRLMVRGDAVQTAKNIVASEQRFRVSIVTSLLTAAGDVVLLVALYIVLRPINQSAALLAACWRFAEAVILAVMALNDFAALRLLSGADYLRGFDEKQLQVLARFFVSVRHNAGQIAVVFLGLGSAVFAYLWWKSRYVPRPLSGLGVASSLLLAIATLAIMVSPSLEDVLAPAYWIPVFVFEVTIGFWLLLKGIRSES